MNENLTLYEVHQFPSPYENSPNYFPIQNIQVFTYWCHYLDFTQVTFHHNLSPESMPFISRLPMAVKFSRKLLDIYEYLKQGGDQDQQHTGENVEEKHYSM